MDNSFIAGFSSPYVDAHGDEYEKMDIPSSVVRGRLNFDDSFRSAKRTTLFRGRNSEATGIFQHQVNHEYNREMEMPGSAVSGRVHFQDSARKVKPPVRMLADRLARPTVFYDTPAADEQNVNEETEQEHDFWIRVIGHRPDEIKAVIRMFSKHGEIVSYQVPDNGNWIWLRYASYIHAEQALSHNASFLKEGTLVAVFSCAENEVPDEPLMNVDKVTEKTTDEAAGFAGEQLELGNSGSESTAPPETQKIDQANLTKSGIRSLITSSHSNTNMFVHGEVEGIWKKLWDVFGPC